MKWFLPIPALIWTLGLFQNGGLERLGDPLVLLGTVISTCLVLYITFTHMVYELFEVLFWTNDWFPFDRHDSTEAWVVTLVQTALLAIAYGIPLFAQFIIAPQGI